MRLRLHDNYLLAGCVLALLTLCLLSISQPLRFDHERERRESAVKERLIEIRRAQAAYLRARGTYCADLDRLVREGYLADRSKYIPNTENKRFTLTTTVVTTPSGRRLPLMECGALYTDYLKGMDKRQTAALMRTATEAGRYPGLKIGDITISNNNAGNWE